MKDALGEFYFIKGERALVLWFEEKRVIQVVPRVFIMLIGVLFLI